MSKKLSEMTLQELWQLFPIVLCAPNGQWALWFQEECQILKSILPGNVQIHHIGSTAVPGIWVKPIVDILVEASSNDFSAIERALGQNAYLRMNAEAFRRDYNKGYTEDGFAERVFHLHLRTNGDHDELYFRDYLRACPGIALEYEKLKMSLWKLFEHDRDGYTNAKTEFVRLYTDHAKRLYGKKSW
ncbi:MAG: GrpB family protein [Thermoguttaceae bacterium]|nr:GrpB family protein [Thermoguttaceae bacterium]